VTRTQLDGTVLTPKERLTVAEALREYTVNGARAGFDEQSKGSLAAGKLADFIVIDRDIFARPVDELKDVKVLSTWVGGAERFHRE
jgi:predicted amidohydrolase YtcJ